MAKKTQLKIIEDHGTIGENEDGYTKKLIKAQWYGKPPVYEIRTFDADGEPKKRPGLYPEELKELKALLNKMDI